MTLRAHKEGLSGRNIPIVDLDDKLGNAVEILSTARSSSNDKLTKSGHFVEELTEVEILALNMLDDEEARSLAVRYSVLKDEAAVKRLHPIRPIYYILWPLAMIEAVRVFLKILFFRLTHWSFKKSEKIEEQIEFLLGPQKSMSFVFDGFSPILFAVRHGVATSSTLDLIYNYHQYKKEIKSRFVRMVLGFWFDQPDSLGVRNRLKLVYTNLVSLLEDQYKIGKREVSVLSLACGSAQATIEAITTIKIRHPDLKIRLELVDLSQPSLRRASLLAKNRLVGPAIDIDIRIVQANIKDYFTSQRDESWDIVEMVGFLDYRKDNSIVDTGREIKRIMKHDAVFITASICPSPWAFIVRWLVNWPLLIRRSKENFHRLLFLAGFVSTKDKYIFEPTKIFLVAICHK